MLSVNQLAAQIKLTEVWKAANVEGFAISLDPYRPIPSELDADITHDLRPRTNRVFNGNAKLLVSQQSFNIDAARLWNLAPAQITTAVTLKTAKAAILKHAKSLPV